jgi:hypothetical protein
MNKKIKKLSDMRVGSYDVRVVKKVVEETNLPVKEGGIYYIVRVDRESWIDVLNLVDAEMLSRQVRIESLLKKLTKGVFVSYPKYANAQQTNQTKYKWKGDKVEFSNILEGKDAVDFVKKMKATEKRKPNKVEKYLMEALK